MILSSSYSRIPLSASISRIILELLYVVPIDTISVGDDIDSTFVDIILAVSPREVDPIPMIELSISKLAKLIL